MSVRGVAKTAKPVRYRRSVSTRHGRDWPDLPCEWCGVLCPKVVEIVRVDVQVQAVWETHASAACCSDVCAQAVRKSLMVEAALKNG